MIELSEGLCSLLYYVFHLIGGPLFYGLAVWGSRITRRRIRFEYETVDSQQRAEPDREKSPSQWLHRPARRWFPWSNGDQEENPSPRWQLQATAPPVGKPEAPQAKETIGQKWERLATALSHVGAAFESGFEQGALVPNTT